METEDEARVEAPEVVVGANRAREIVVDEDVLSLGLKASLESVGSAVGFLGALAVIAVCVVRMRRQSRAAPVGR